MCEDNERQAGWTREYDTLHGIHLGYSGAAPTAVTTFLDAVSTQTDMADSMRVLDICCGKGRIGLHLAKRGFHVTGFDFAKPAIDTFREMAREMGVGDNVTLFEQDIAAPWDLPDRHFQAALAVTAIENFTTDHVMAYFADELSRVLTDNAVVVLEFYGQNDGYYSTLERLKENREFIVHDPRNGMDFRLYTPEEVMTFLRPGFNVSAESVEHFKSVKYGADYPRETHLLTLRRKIGG